MHHTETFAGTRHTLCNICGIPMDAEHFDESGVAGVPAPGEDVILARFTLHPQYCGVLNYFVQFTDLFFKNPSQIETPGLQWLLLTNNRPLFPYVKVDKILNPWGFTCIPVAIRLDENATIEFVVRNAGAGAAENGEAITKVGGRIVGRYWYNHAYGDVARRNR